MTYFDNTYYNMVGWDSETSRYNIVFKASSKGVEVSGPPHGDQGHFPPSLLHLYRFQGP